MSRTVTYYFQVDSSGAVTGAGEAEQAIQGMEQQTESVGTTSVAVGTILADAFSSAARHVGSFAMDSVRAGMDFEEAMSRVGGLSNATEGELGSLQDTARELGSTTEFSATEAAEGMQFLAMAGFEVNEQMDAMPGLLSAAAANKTDLGTTADIVSNILSGFNMEAEETNRLADILTQTTTTSNTSLEMLGDTMSFVAPVAEDLGFEITDVAAAAGRLGDAGIQGSRAGTALRAGFQRLVSPSTEAKDVLEDLNVELEDQEGNMLEMTEIIGQLESATEDMTEAQRSQTLSTIFGQQASSAFSVLLSEGADELRNYSDQLDNSQGRAEELAEQQRDNLAGATKEFNSALEGLQITLFNQTGPAMQNMVEIGTNVVRLLDNMVGSSRDLSASYQEQAGFVDDLTNGTEPLLDRYEELENKTDLSRSEQEELNGIIQRLSDTVPITAQEFDKYGNAIGISTERSREFIDQQREILRLETQDEYENQVTSLSRLAVSLQEIQRNLERTGVEFREVDGEMRMLTDGAERLSRPMNDDLIPEELIEEYQNLQTQIRGVLTNIEDLDREVIGNDETLRFHQGTLSDIADAVGFVSSAQSDASEESEEATQKHDDQSDAVERLLQRYRELGNELADPPQPPEEDFAPEQQDFQFHDEYDEREEREFQLHMVKEQIRNTEQEWLDADTEEERERLEERLERLDIERQALQQNREVQDVEEERLHQQRMNNRQAELEEKRRIAEEEAREIQRLTDMYIGSAHERIGAEEMLGNVFNSINAQQISSLSDFRQQALSVAQDEIGARIRVGVASAVANALRDIPFPLNLAAAATAGIAAQGLFNAAINQISPPAMAEGGTVPVMLSNGEFVFSPEDAAGNEAALQAMNANPAQAREIAETQLVTGPGTGTSDSIPTRMRPGSFVLNAESTRRAMPALSRAEGGSVGSNYKKVLRTDNGLKDSLDRLNSRLDDLTVQVRGRIKGDDILLVNEEAEKVRDDNKIEIE